MRQGQKKITIHGHRGSRGTHPENTIPSFAEAWACGCEFVELDVHLTADGHLIVFHDNEISGRLCRDANDKPLECPIPIAKLQLEDIRSLEVGSQRLAMFPEQKPAPGARIPTLEELILWKKANASGLKLNVEIKAGSAPPERLAQATLELLSKHNLLGESLVQSFDPEIVRSARKQSREVKLSCLFERPEDFARLARDCRAQVVAAHYLLVDERLYADCRGAGLEVLPWTVNDAAHWDRLVALGIDAIITDYPRRFAAR